MPAPNMPFLYRKIFAAYHKPVNTTLHTASYTVIIYNPTNKNIIAFSSLFVMHFLMKASYFLQIGSNTQLHQYYGHPPHP